MSRYSCLLALALGLSGFVFDAASVEPLLDKPSNKELRPFIEHCETGVDAPAASVSLASLRSALRGQSGGAFEFSQRARIEALDYVEVSRGKISLRSDGAMRWDYVDPEPQSFLVVGKRYWFVQPLDSQIVTGAIDGLFSRKLPLLLLSSGEELGSELELAVLCSGERGRVVVSLSEKQAEFPPVILEVDPKDSTIHAVTSRDLDENWTSLRLVKAEGGPVLKDELFEVPSEPGFDIIEQ